MAEWLESIEWPLNAVDIGVLVFALLLTVRGLVRGLSRELAGGIGALVVLVGGWQLYGPFSEFLRSHTRLQEEGPARLLAFVLCVIGLLVIWKLIALLLERLFEFTFDGGVERIGGMLAGLAKAFLIYATVLFGVGLTEHAFLRRHVLEESWFGQGLYEHVPAGYERVRGWLGLPASASPEEPANDPDAPPADAEKKSPE